MFLSYFKIFTLFLASTLLSTVICFILVVNNLDCESKILSSNLKSKDFVEEKINFVLNDIDLKNKLLEERILKLENLSAKKLSTSLFTDEYIQGLSERELSNQNLLHPENSLSEIASLKNKAFIESEQYKNYQMAVDYGIITPLKNNNNLN